MGLEPSLSRWFSAYKALLTLDRNVLFFFLLIMNKIRTI